MPSEFSNLFQSLPNGHLDDLVARAKDWCLSHGLVMRTASGRNSSEVVNYISFALFPLQIAQSLFDQATELQTHFNLLMHKVCHDNTFMESTLKETIECDDFVANLWSVYLASRSSPHTQPINLLLSRSDYMVDSKHNPPQLRQIEFNTISSGFCGLMRNLPALHKFVFHASGCSEEQESKIVDTKNVEGMAHGLVKAWQLYAQNAAVVMFVVEEGCRNIIDQRWLEYLAADINKTVKVIRRTFKQLQQSAKVTRTGQLYVDETEIAVIYYRTGYMPNDYKSQKDWDLRLLMECSRAIKCPTIQSQLCGAKKVQQVLAETGVLEKFIADPAVCQRMRSTFAGLYSLDLTPEGDEVVNMTSGREDFVLKPQREGGGNNIFGLGVHDKLQELAGLKERSSYILMDRVYPVVDENILVMPDLPITVTPTVSEIGIYGVLLGSAEKVYENYDCGYLVRTKKVGVDEGGVATGYSALNSLYVV